MMRVIYCSQYLLYIGEFVNERAASFCLSNLLRFLPQLFQKLFLELGKGEFFRHRVLSILANDVGNQIAN